MPTTVHPATPHWEVIWNSLLSENPPIGAILEACPYNSELNFDGRLTPEVFLNKLHVSSDYTDNLEYQFKDIFCNRTHMHSRMVFMTGFGRSGKTTFIRTFMEKNQEIYCTYLDFDRLGDIKSKKPIVSLLRQAISKPGLVENGPSRGDLVTVLRKIVEQRNDLRGYFSENFGSYIDRAAEACAVDDDAVDQESMSWKDKDIITVFLLANIHASLEHEGPKVLFFDNLDLVQLDFISSSFQACFVESLLSVNQIIQDKLVFDTPVRFTLNHKFCFSIRDANNAHLPDHIYDHVGNVVRPIPFHFVQDGQFYLSLLKNRVDVISEAVRSGIYVPPNENVARILDNVCALVTSFMDDHIFGNVIAPLYNYNLNKLTLTLLELSEIENFELLLEEITDEDCDTERFEHRGSILFWVLKKLFDNNFLQDFVLKVATSEDVGEDDNDEYCLPSRMILTYLINTLDSNGDPQQQAEVDRKKVTLWGLIESGFMHETIYSYKAILDTLESMFLCHAQNWTHLITLVNKKIKTDGGSFKKEEKLLARYRDDEEEKKRHRKMLSRLKGIHIRVNPSGYSLVRHILPHFEYYSVIVGSNDRPLVYWKNEKASDNVDSPYRFEKVIDSVLKRVTKHADLMNGFLNEAFIEGLNWTEQQYRHSNFAWKHFKRGLRARGQFHITRICNYHIGYIDTYRMTLLSRIDDHAEKVNVNRALVQKLVRYVILMKNHVEDSNRRFFTAYDQKIDKIVASGYADFVTRVNTD